MAKEITKAATDEMAGYRQEALNYNFSELNRENFSDDASYRQALVAQYQGLRQQEFGYVVQNEAMKAYNVASEANKAKQAKIENTSTGAWSGYRQRPEARDSSFVHVPRLVEIGDTPNSGESCAISANALTLQISNQMGYTGQDNLIVPKSRIVYRNGKPAGCSRENNLSAASCIHLQDSIPQQYRLSFDNKKKPTLNEAIKQGLVGAGDEISVVTGAAQGTTTSGCHAMVIVDVEKDDNGKVKNYTLQCNNPPCLKTIDANKPDYYGNRPLYSSVRTSQWIQDKINSEIPENMTIEEIEAKVTDSRGRVSSLVDNLHATEVHYVENKHYNDVKPVGVSAGFGEHYNEELSQARAISEERAAAVTDVTQTANENQDAQSIPQYTLVDATVTPTDSAPTVTADELRGQTGELAEDKPGREGATVAIKDGPMYKGVSYREVTRDLEQTDERTVEQALRDGNNGQVATQTEPVAAATSSKTDEQETKAPQTSQNPGYRFVPVNKKPVTSRDAEPAPKKQTEMTVAQLQAILAARKR